MTARVSPDFVRIASRIARDPCRYVRSPTSGEAPCRCNRGLQRGYGRVVRPRGAVHERIPSRTQFGERGIGCTPDLPVPFCRIDRARRRRVRWSSKPCSLAWAICAAVTGETDPETQAMRSTGCRAKRLAGGRSIRRPANRRRARPRTPANRRQTAARRACCSQTRRPASIRVSLSSTSIETTWRRRAISRRKRASPRRASSPQSRRGQSSVSVWRARWRPRSASSMGVTGWRDMTGCRSSRWRRHAAIANRLPQRLIAAHARIGDDHRRPAVELAALQSRWPDRSSQCAARSSNVEQTL